MYKGSCSVLVQSTMQELLSLSLSLHELPVLNNRLDPADRHPVELRE